ncbi:MAG TPA: glycosyltransferase [Longimicrobiales bacterium]|nr:glycosyltransferase [Longimicrobiales bacterium]
MSRPAPVALFAYNRPEHLSRTITALAANDLASDTEVYVYCDGPRGSADEADVCRVREVARAARGFASVRVVERPGNFGLARSVISGVSETVEEHGRTIVLEDDLVTSPYFLRFMNAALEHYEHEKRVVSISGYTFPVAGPLPETFFMPGAFCWGWATWRRGWALFEHDARRVLDEIVRRDLIYEFDFRGTDPLTKLLHRTAIGDARADSWATRWIGAAFLRGKLTLYPGKSLIANTGFDGSGRHAPRELRYATELATTCPRVGTVATEVDPEVILRHRALFASWRARGNPWLRAYYRLTSVMPARLEKRIYTTVVRRRLRKIEHARR